MAERDRLRRMAVINVVLRALGMGVTMLGLIGIGVAAVTGHLHGLAPYPRP